MNLLPEVVGSGQFAALDPVTGLAWITWSAASAAVPVDGGTALTGTYALVYEPASGTLVGAVRIGDNGTPGSILIRGRSVFVGVAQPALGAPPTDAYPVTEIDADARTIVGAGSSGNGSAVTWLGYLSQDDAGLYTTSSNGVGMGTYPIAPSPPYTLDAAGYEPNTWWVYNSILNPLTGVRAYTGYGPWVDLRGPVTRSASTAAFMGSLQQSALQVANGASPVVYPAALPPPIRAPFTPAERRLLSSAPGPRASRPLQRDNLATQDLEFIFTASECATWQAWLDGPLAHAGGWFASDWPHPAGGVHVRRFAGAPAAPQFYAGVGYRVTCSTELRGAGELPRDRSQARGIFAISPNGPGVVRVDTLSGSVFAFAPALWPTAMYFSPDTNVLYVQGSEPRFSKATVKAYDGGTGEFLAAYPDHVNEHLSSFTSSRALGNALYLGDETFLACEAFASSAASRAWRIGFTPPPGR